MLIKKLVDRLLQLLNGFSMLGLVLMMLVVTADVVSRYIFGKSLHWVYSFTEAYLMVIIVFLGIAYTHYHDDHIRFELIMEKLPRRALRILNIFIHLLIMVFFALIAYQGMDQVMHAWENDISTGGVVSLPLYLSYIWVPIGSILAMLISVMRIIDNILNTVNSTENQTSNFTKEV